MEQKMRNLFRISNKDEINQITEILIAAFGDLRENDKQLIGNHGDNESYCNKQKLHEVCINHRLAIYIEKHLKCKNLNYNVDIEYNKKNYSSKEIEINGNCKEVRPDIIVHIRANNKGIQDNYLIIEAKKDKNSTYDKNKINSFMRDPSFLYKFGCKIIYGDLGESCNIKLYYSENGQKIDYVEIKLDKCHNT